MLYHSLTGSSAKFLISRDRVTSWGQTYSTYLPNNRVTLHFFVEYDLCMLASFIRLFFLARYDIPFWSLRAQQQLVLCANHKRVQEYVQNTSVDINNTHIDHIDGRRLQIVAAAIGRQRWRRRDGQRRYGWTAAGRRMTAAEDSWGGGGYEI